MTDRHKQSIKNSKNAVTGSVQAGGNVDVGDRTSSSHNTTGSYNRTTNINIGIGSITVGGLFLLLVAFGAIPAPWSPGKASDAPANEVIEKVEEGKPEPSPTTATPIKPDVTPTVRSTPSATPQPVQPALADYVDVSRRVPVALYLSNALQLTAVRSAVLSHFQSAGAPVSGTFFRPGFQGRFGSQLPHWDMGALNTLGLGQYANCICQIREDIETKAEDLDGYAFYTASGTVTVHLLHLGTGSLSSINLARDLKGAGVSKEAAVESLSEKILNSGRLSAIEAAACR